MPLVELVVHRKRSGPVFLDRDGETVTHVYETEQRQIVIGGGKTPVIKLPARSWRFVIDSAGVARVSEESHSYRLLLPVAIIFLVALLLLRRLSRAK